MQLEIADETTFTLTFVDPKPLFIYEVGRLNPGDNANEGLYAPGHYMAQFQPNLTDDAAGLVKTTFPPGSGISLIGVAPEGVVVAGSLLHPSPLPI